MYYAYVLRSLKNGRFYTGSTDNIERRLLEHNSGKSKYTSHVGPFQLLYFEAFAIRQEAVKREMALKSGQGRQWLKQKFG